jgi:hypothetical protein
VFGTKIKLDGDLLQRCKKYAQEVGYSSVEVFISHTLEKELRNKEKRISEDEKEVIERLKGLGYI